ncbi:hypothetical protein B0H14DRAFT_2280794, partial [Mycena olivaceomarginata]
PDAYLFVCPTKHLQTGPTSFQWPECPAYWSLDPSGTERLSVNEATRFGLPSVYRVAICEGNSWDGSFYAGLRKFHEAKGFDPESQDVARHLDQPLWQV